MKLDTGYIKDYILNYDIGIPLIVVIVTCLFVCGIVLLLFRVKTDNAIFARQTSFCLLMGYVFLVLCTTIFYREETFEKRYNLYPLSSYTMLYNNLLAQIISLLIIFSYLLPCFLA